MKAAAFSGEMLVWMKERGRIMMLEHLKVEYAAPA